MSAKQANAEVVVSDEHVHRGLVQRQKVLAVYAHALGIDYWIAKKPLSRVDPHLVLAAVAPDSPPIAPDQASAQSLADLTGPTRSDGPTVSPAASLARQFGSTEQPIALENVPAATHKTPARSAASFELCAVIHEDILLVDDITGLSITVSAYQDWLNAIFIAIGRPALKHRLTSGDRLSWPTMHGNRGDTDNSLSAASQMIQGWLSRKIETQQQNPSVIRHLMLMGAMPQHLLLNAQTNRALSLGTTADLAAVSLQGSRDLWPQPAQKRELWRQLQAMNTPGL